MVDEQNLSFIVSNSIVDGRHPNSIVSLIEQVDGRNPKSIVSNGALVGRNPNSMVSNRTFDGRIPNSIIAPVESFGDGGQ